MGFQPAIFDNKATEPAWSPFWQHLTLVWKEDATPRVLQSSDEGKAAYEANLAAGVPQTLAAAGQLQATEDLDMLAAVAAEEAN